MSMKEDIEELRATDDYKEARDKAVERAHEFLMELENCGPLELTLFLSHCLSHLLMSAPSEHDLMEMFAVFLVDLDIKEVVKDWNNLSEKEKAENRAEAEDSKPTLN